MNNRTWYALTVNHSVVDVFPDQTQAERAARRSPEITSHVGVRVATLEEVKAHLDGSIKS